MAKNKDIKQAREPEQVSKPEKQPAEKPEENLNEPLTHNYRCFFCGKHFMSQDALITHMRREHSGDD